MVTARHFFYNLNLLDNSSINSLELKVKTRISTNTINMWKNPYRIVLTEDPIDVDIKVGNQSDIVYHSDKLAIFQDALISIICSLYLLW